MKPKTKPLFILNPQVLVDNQKIAKEFVNQIKSEMSVQAPITSLDLDTFAGESTVNGIFNYDQFLAKVRVKAPAFTSEGAGRFLQAALDSAFTFKIDEESLRGLMDRGDVSLLLSVDSGMPVTSYDKAGIKIPSPSTLIERKIMQHLRSRFPKELRETREGDTFKLDEKKPLTTVQLENKKKPYGQLLHDYVDLATDKKWQVSPQVIETNPGHLNDFRKTHDQSKKGDKFNEAGVDVFFVNSRYMDMKVPAEIKPISALDKCP